MESPPSPSNMNSRRQGLTRIDALVELIQSEGDRRGDVKQALDELGQPGARDALTTQSQSEGGLTPLQAACVSEDDSKIHMLELLISYGPDINKPGDNESNTPLHAAVKSHSIKCVTLLRRLGADVTILNSKRCTPQDIARDEISHLSVDRFKPLAIHKLLDAVQVEEKSSSDPVGPRDEHEVFLAIQRKDHAKLTTLLQHNPAAAITRISDRVWWTPFHLAACLLNSQALKILSAVKIDAEELKQAMRDEHGWTPMHWVVLHLCISVENESICRDMVKILEGTQAPLYDARVCTSTGLPELLWTHCYVSEVVPNFKTKLEKKTSENYVLYFSKKENSEDSSANRFQCMMWYENNPKRDLIATFEPSNERSMTFRTRGYSESILSEKGRTVFYDDQNETIAVRPTHGNRLQPEKYRWARSTETQHEKDWALKKVPSFLHMFHSMSEQTFFKADEIMFRPLRIERVTPTMETYVIDVLNPIHDQVTQPSLWTMSFIRHNLEMAGTVGLETRLVFKMDGQIKHQCDLNSLIWVEEGNFSTRVNQFYTGHTVLHWCTLVGLINWVELFLKHECDPFDGGMDGQSPYFLALQCLNEIEKEQSSPDEVRKKQFERVIACFSQSKWAKKVADKFTASTQQPTTSDRNVLDYIYELSSENVKKANNLFGITKDDAKMFLFHHMIAVGKIELVSKAKEVLNLDEDKIDKGRTLSGDVKEYAVGVAGLFGRLDILKKLTGEHKCKLHSSVLSEAMKGGHVDVAMWYVDREKVTSLKCIPSAEGSNACEEGGVTVIPRIEELEFCSKRGLVTTRYLEKLLIRSSKWEKSTASQKEPTDMLSGGKTAVLLHSLQNDKIRYHVGKANEPLAPLAGTDDEWLKRVKGFLSACLKHDTLMEVHHIVCVNSWHPEDHCSFENSNLKRDPLTGDDPRKTTKHCVQNTWGAEVHKEIFDIIGDVAKVSHCGTDASVNVQSAFYEKDQLARTGLQDLLENLNVQTLIVIGLPYETSVRYTVSDALHLGYEVFVVEDLCIVQGSNKDDATNDMLRRGARVLSEKKMRKKEKKSKDDEKKVIPTSIHPSMSMAIQFLLNVPNIRYHIIFEKDKYADEFRNLVNGFNFGSGPSTGHLFLYLASFVSERRAKAFNRGFTIENTKFESGDYDALQFPLHYLIMRYKYAPSVLERRSAKNLLMKVIQFINSTTKIPLDDIGNPMIVFPSDKTPRDYATWFPPTPCARTLDEALAEGKTEKDRCKCIFHVPLRAFKPGPDDGDKKKDRKAMKEQVQAWDLWNENFFRQFAGMGSSKLDAIQRQRPLCPVGMKRHVFPVPPKASPPLEQNKDNTPVREMEHLLCCSPLRLAVRLKLFDVVDQMMGQTKESSGLVITGRSSGKDATGDNFAFDEIEDVWQAIPYDRRPDGTMVMNGSPSLHFALRTMREPNINSFPPLRQPLTGCAVNGQRSLVELMKAYNKITQQEKEANQEDMGEDAGGAAKAKVTTTEPEENEDDTQFDIPIQDAPLDIAKGCAPIFFAGTLVMAWNTDEPLDLERYKALVDEFKIETPDEDRKIVWALPTEHQWLCPECGCTSEHILPQNPVPNGKKILSQLIDFLCLLRVCLALLKASASTPRFVEKGGESVKCVKLDVGPNRQRYVGKTFDRAGFFEFSGYGWVDSLNVHTFGDTGLSLVLQYAPQLINQVLDFNLFDLSPFDTYDDLNNLVHKSNAAVLIQRRHLWKATRGGVELCVYDKGLSLLHWAALLNNEALCKMLLLWGANVVSAPLTIRLGYTPIHYASYSASVGTLRLMLQNITDEQGAEEAENYANKQAMPRVIDKGLLTYNQLHASKKVAPGPPTIRDMVLNDRRYDPMAWPKKTRLEQLTDPNSDKYFYGAVNTIGETALHVSASFCHQICIEQLVNVYKADVGIRSTLEGFDAHDVAISLLHKAQLQQLEDNLNQKQKGSNDQINEQKDLKTLEGMCTYLNARESVLDKLKAYSLTYFRQEALTYVVFTLCLTLFGFLYLDIPVTGGMWWINEAVRDSVIGEEFKLNFSRQFLASEPGPDMGTQFRANTADLGEIGDVISWIKGPLRQKFFSLDPQSSSDTESSPFCIENKYRLVGAVRIGALRIRYDSCSIPVPYQKEMKTCYTSYTKDNLNKTDMVLDDIIPYKKWNTYTFQQTLDFDSVGWQSWISDLFYPTQQGNYVDIEPGNVSYLDAKFGLMDNFLGSDVQFVMIFVNLYAVNLNRYVVVELYFESPPHGKIGFTHRFTTVRLNRYESSLDWFRLALEIIVLSLMISFVNEEGVEIVYMIKHIRLEWMLLRMRLDSEEQEERKAKTQEVAASPKARGKSFDGVQTIDSKELVQYLRLGLNNPAKRYRTEGHMSQPLYVCPKRLQSTESILANPLVERFRIVVEEIVDHLTSDWNIIDLSVLGLLFVFVGYHIFMFSIEDDAGTTDVMMRKNRGFVDAFTTISYYTNVQQKTYAFIVLLSWIKMLKYIKILPDTGPIAAAIVGTVGNKQIGTFVVILVVVVMAFVFSCYFAFQSNVEGMRTFRLSFFFVVRMVVGDSDFDSLMAGHLHMGPLMWFICVFFVVIMLMNILIAVVGNVYEQLINAAEAEWSSEISECYRQDVLGLPNLKRPFGSYFVQLYRRCLGLCFVKYRREYQKAQFKPVKQEDRNQLEITGLPKLPHLRMWDCVSSLVVERMEQYNYRLNLTNEDLQNSMESHATGTAGQIALLHKKLDNFETQMQQIRTIVESLAQAKKESDK